MKSENTEKLFAAFPNLYRDKNLPMSQSLMIFGFCVEDGWFDIIWELSTKLENIIAKLPIEEADLCRAFQCKEKFGSLRFYLNGHPENFYEEVNAAIKEAETKSAKTCEQCGKPGVLRKGGWIKVRCDDC